MKLNFNCKLQKLDEAPGSPTKMRLSPRRRCNLQQCEEDWEDLRSCSWIEFHTSVNLSLSDVWRIYLIWMETDVQSLRRRQSCSAQIWWRCWKLNVGAGGPDELRTVRIYIWWSNFLSKRTERENLCWEVFFPAFSNLFFSFKNDMFLEFSLSACYRRVWRIFGVKHKLHLHAPLLRSVLLQTLICRVWIWTCETGMFQ